jgi:hypothetical protein
LETTVVINEELLERAEDLTGLHEVPKILDEALRALVAREAARQLADLGGSEPDAQDIPRRCSASSACPTLPSK